MLVCIYLRVSHVDSLDGYSLEAQEEACRVYLAARGWHLACDPFVDRAVSGQKLGREAMQRMLAYVSEQRIGAVLVFELDRAFRNLRDQLNTHHDLQAARVRLISVLDDVDTGTPEGMLHFQMKGMISEYQAKQTGRKTKISLAIKAQRGEWVGFVPTGYDRIDGKLVPNVDAAIVKLVFAWYATGVQSYADIAERLNDAGHRTVQGQPFKRESIQAILDHKAYIGIVCNSSGKEYAGQHEPLIERALWEQAQAARAARSVVKPGRVQKDRGGWLGGYVWCADCGRRVWHMTGGSGGLRRYYRCSGRDARLCGAPLAHAEQVEQDMLAYLGALTLPADLHQAVLDAVADRDCQEQRPAPVDTAAIQARLRRLARTYEDGLKLEAEYTRERDMLQAQLVEAPPVTARADLTAAAALLTNLPTLLAGARPRERQAVVHALFRQVTIQERRIVRLEPRPDVAPLLIAVCRVVQCIDAEPLILTTQHAPPVELTIAIS